MPNPSNITAPFLVIGPGRSGTSWLLHALDEHPDVRDIIENNVVDHMHDALLKKWWARDWKWVCEPDEARRRVVESTHQTLCTLFPTHQRHWVMKAIWSQRNLAWHREIFPNARWIHITRSPTTALPSMKESIGDLFSNFSYCQTQFVESHKKALEIKNDGLPYIRIRQEDAAANPSEVWERLSEFCGLSPAPEGHLKAEVNVSKSTAGSVRRGRDPLPWSKINADVHEIARSLGYEPDAEPRRHTILPTVEPAPTDPNAAAAAAHMDLEQRVAAANTLGGRKLAKIVVQKLVGRMRSGGKVPTNQTPSI